MRLTLRSSERGVALAETVLMMSFIMLMLFALVQTGMASYYQVSADGATFVGAHTAVVNDPTGSGTGPSIAKSIAESVFQGLGKATVTLMHPTSTTTETDISFASGGFGIGGQQFQPVTTSREVETSADNSTASATGTLPPNDTVLCVANGIDSVTGQVSNQPIGGYTPGSLLTTASSTAGALSGSLSITQGTINGTFGTVQPAVDAVNAATSTLTAELATISGDVTVIQSTPLGSVVGSTVTSVVAGTALAPVGGLAPSLPVATGVGTVAGAISGQTGAVSEALEGTLSSSQYAMLVATIGQQGATASGIIGVLSKLPATTQVNQLIADLGKLAPDVAALNAAEAAVNKIDSTVAGTACPGS